MIVSLQIPFVIAGIGPRRLIARAAREWRRLRYTFCVIVPLLDRFGTIQIEGRIFSNATTRRGGFKSMEWCSGASSMLYSSVWTSSPRHGTFGKQGTLGSSRGPQRLLSESLFRPQHTASARWTLFFGILCYIALTKDD